MKEYFQSIGWVFGGMCGCRENKSIYTNPEYPEWQVWLTTQGDRCEFRKSYGNERDTSIKGRAGQMNYKDAYEYWVLNDRD